MFHGVFCKIEGNRVTVCNVLPVNRDNITVRVLNIKGKIIAIDFALINI
jgi:hypothetical protein